MLALQEDIAKGQRLEKFIGEYFYNGKWEQFAAGTTVGYKRLIKLNRPVTTNKIRFKILSSRLNPMLAEYGLYKLAL